MQKLLENAIRKSLNRHLVQHVNVLPDKRCRVDIMVEEATNEILKLVVQADAISWVAFDWDKIETRPTEYGKYFICRKDGKIHWETWNGSGWAYNHNEIKFWARITPPCL